MERWKEEIRDRYGYEISNSLKRSKSRTRSLLYIGDHPYKSILEISLGIGINYANTYGAIIGDGKKYSRKYSLAGMSLALYETIGNVHVCKLTELGKNIHKIIKDNADQIE